MFVDVCHTSSFVHTYTYSLILRCPISHSLNKTSENDMMDIHKCPICNNGELSSEHRQVVGNKSSSSYDLTSVTPPQSIKSHSTCGNPVIEECHL